MKIISSLLHIMMETKHGIHYLMAARKAKVSMDRQHKLSKYLCPSATASIAPQSSLVMFELNTLCQTDSTRILLQPNNVCNCDHDIVTCIQLLIRYRMASSPNHYH